MFGIWHINILKARIELYNPAIYITIQQFTYYKDLFDASLKKNVMKIRFNQYNKATYLIASYKYIKTNNQI